MKFTVDGETYEQVEQDRLTFAEADAIERATGMTLPEIERKSNTCVCGHQRRKAHRDEALEDGRDLSCGVCECPEFSPAVPSCVATASLWVSMKRQNPTLTYTAVEAIEQGSITFDQEVEAEQLLADAANPTDPPEVSGGNEPNGSLS